jgi:hypothetical protein
VAYREKLPPDCPPDGCNDGECEVAFRFVSANPPTDDDFASNSAKEEPLPPGVDICRWSSCSLYTDMDTVHKKRKLKKLQKIPFVAAITIAAGSGHWTQANNHIDFWMFDTFDPLKAVVQVEAL